jgi:serine/threonine protein kinase/TolB-like protein/tetratricopeptide (TPR) repeat protein
MKPERWQQLDELFHAALERKPQERAAFLDEACAGDEALRQRVEALLAAHEQAGSFIESPAMEVEARGVAADQRSTGAGMATGETVSHYRIISPLGSGGMGDVYLAQDTILSRQVALKLLPEHFTKDRDRLRRFQQEARAASALNHPNIITIYEIGEVDHRHFIVTEFIYGQTLRQRISGSKSHTAGDSSGKSGTPLRLPNVLNIAIQTSDALAAAHEAGIVHRDIKPENIMVRRRDGYVKVLDFGLAKLTQGPDVTVDPEAPTRAQFRTSAGVVMGTPTYMSPEQARGEQVDVRTDIWSLGVVLYEMVAGCAPFERSTPSEVIASILEREPPPLARFTREVPAELERIVSKALTKDKEERYQTSRDLLVDLRRLRQRVEVEAEIARTSQPAETSNKEEAAATGDEQKVAVTARAAGVETRNEADADSTSTAYPVKKLKHHRGALIALAAIVAVTAVAGYFAYSRYRAEGSRANNSTAGIHSVAVLPFTNATGNPDTEYLSDGVSESLINSLSQLPGMKVTARSSSFKYKGKNADPQEVAKALEVAAILTGRVEQRGDNLLISVELVDARDKTQVWGERYNRKATDLLAVQSDISREVAATLRLKLSNAQQQQLGKRETVNPQAYELALKGRFYQNKGTEYIKEAAGYYEQAIAIDPNYALAYAQLSYVYSTGITFSFFDPKEFIPKAEAAAQKALALDESLAEAHLAAGTLRTFAWDWTATERELKRTIELNPNLSSARIWYAYYFSQRKQPDKAVAEIKSAREVDPLSPSVNTNVGLVLHQARRYDEAIEALKKARELDQNFSFAQVVLGYTYAAMKRYPAAIAAYQEGIKLGDDSPSTQIYLGVAYAGAGERGRAQAILKRMKTSKGYVSPAELAALYIALGEREQAFASLERAYAAHDLQLQFLGVDASFDSLRSDLRYQDLMRRVGLTP